MLFGGPKTTLVFSGSVEEFKDLSKVVIHMIIITEKGTDKNLQWKKVHGVGSRKYQAHVSGCHMEMELIPLILPAQCVTTCTEYCLKGNSGGLMSQNFTGSQL